MIKKAKTKEQAWKEIARTLLGSINLNVGDPGIIHDKKERQEFLGKCSVFFISPEYKALKNFLEKEQLLFMAKESLDWEQVMFSRGTLNGFDLLDQKLELYHNQYIDMTRPEEKFDKHKMGGETDS